MRPSRIYTPLAFPRSADPNSSSSAITNYCITVPRGTVTVTDSRAFVLQYKEEYNTESFTMDLTVQNSQRIHKHRVIVFRGSQRSDLLRRVSPMP